MWFVFALGSAVFAALTSILAKIGIQGVNSTLATAIRTVVVLVMSWGMVFLTGTQGGVGDISRHSWLFLILSGLATGASWLCYYHALQIGAASKVVPVDKLSVVLVAVFVSALLGERPSLQEWAGIGLVAAGVLLLSRYIDAYGTVQKALNRYYGGISVSYLKKVNNNMAMLQNHSEKNEF